MATVVRCDKCGNEASYRQGRVTLDSANGTRVLTRDVCNECVAKIKRYITGEK